MRYTVTILECQYEHLTTHLFQTTNEAAAYLLCAAVSTSSEKRLLVREVHPVPDSDIESSTETHMDIRQSSFLRAIKRAADDNLCFVFVHSHPVSNPNHSSQDDLTEAPLFRTAYNRIHCEDVVHGSIVISSPEKPIGRIWLPDNTFEPMERIRIIGNRFHFLVRTPTFAIDRDLFSRQILAFGEDLQQLLSILMIGVIGLGATGSAVAEQLTRLGVGRLLLADDDKLESSNVTRVHGSRKCDVGSAKVEVFRRYCGDIGLGTDIQTIEKSISDQTTMQKFRDCDVVFCCIDRERGRSILTRFALYYAIPVFDVGVAVDTDGDRIKSVDGRITTLLPGTACLNCRERISSDVVTAEVLEETNPKEYALRRKQGYIRALTTDEPSVIQFTTTVASLAVNELIHRLTGYMGEDRNTSEVLVLFEDCRIRTNATKPASDCWCADLTNWCAGDVSPFIGLTW